MMKKIQPKFSEIVVFRTAIKFFDVCGFIPRDEERFSTIFKLKFITIFSIFILPALVGNYFYLWKVLTQDKISLHSLIQCLYVNGLFLAAAVTGLAALAKGNEIFDFFYYLGNHKYSEPDNLDAVYEIHDKISLYIFFFSQITLIVKVIMDFHKNSFCEAKYKFQDDKYFCGMIMPFWLPVHLNIFMKLWVFIGLNSIFLLYIPTAVLGFFIVYGVSELIVIRMEKLNCMLQKLDFHGNDEAVGNQLLECIEYHSDLWNLVNRMNNSLGICHIYQYTLVTTIIGLVEYELFISSNILMSISQLMILIIGESMVCFAGQNIENKREAMAVSLYLTPWYRLPLKLRKTFTIFLAKTQVPLHFEARPMANLNYEFLMKVLKGSYTFFMFLQNNTKQND